jgi:hypothetical protein
MYQPLGIFPFKSGLSKYYKPFLIGNDAFVELDNVYSWRGYIKKREGSTVISRVAKWGSFTALTNASPPVVTMAAHGLITGDSVYLENVIMTNGAISSIASGLSTVVTVAGAPGISVGQTVIISGTTGVSTTSATIPFNGTPFYVTAVGANTITLNVQTSGSAGAGGNVLLGSITNQAFQITFINVNSFSLQILNSSPAVNQPASGASLSGDVYLPIVGTRVFLDSLQNEKLIVFTPKKAYEYNISTTALDDISFNRTPLAISWSGSKDNFFYSSNYAGSLWATNNVFGTTNQPYGIRIFNGSLTDGWQDFEPHLLSTSTTFLNSALIVLPYKGYMVTLNTTEGPADNSANINYFNRARWSQLGTPYYQATPPAQFGFDVNAWVTDIVGKGGFTDADTNERIVSAAIIQDTLIVGFQFSTWRLRFTGNFIQPFIWERINTQYGSEATFSAVSFDQSLLMISRRGIVGATFNDVDRIDLEVPDFVNEFETGFSSEGLNRIQGIRDFQKRLVYWLYADEAANNQTPNKILCYNYEDNTWSTFTQSFTTLANYKLTNTDNTWQTWLSTWIGDSATWNTPLEQSNTPIVVAGDIKSQIWQIMNQDYSDDNGVNYNFTITTNIFNPYFEKGKRCKLAYYDLYITNTSEGQITLENYIDDDPSDPWLIKTVDTNDKALSVRSVKTVKYIRVFLGQIARNHQIKLTLTDQQLADPYIGKSDFELQGIIMHTREEGRIKN